MASATLSITITDTVNHSLAQVRDRLLTKWNYPGGGTAQDKLDFIEAHIAQYIKQQYKEQLQMESFAANEAADLDVQ